MFEGRRSRRCTVDLDLGAVLYGVIYSLIDTVRTIDELFSALPVIEEESNFLRASAVFYGSSLRSFRRVRFSAERKQILRVYKSEMDGQMTITV